MDKCPLCGSHWDNPTYDEVSGDNHVCARRCGFMKTQWGNVLREVGQCWVWWYKDPSWVWWHKDPTECRVWLQEITIYEGEALPYDISEDMIRMLLVFQ